MTKLFCERSRGCTAATPRARSAVPLLTPGSPTCLVLRKGHTEGCVSSTHLRPQGGRAVKGEAVTATGGTSGTRALGAALAPHPAAERPW